ncbi:MAG: phage baseplate assembly protein [Dokdonella sp.]|uniref:phage baseplate assembly protein n=1 Tax=Dokdonella sp. TaxID=2291710 RepID=UPI003F7D7224
MTEPVDPVIQKVTVRGAAARSDDVTITIDGQVYGGWQDVRITRGVERLPSDFDLRMTDIHNVDADMLQILPGKACVVSIGPDPVITGYVDVVAPSFDKGSHEILVTGRGKCQDLVDCSAEWPGGQIDGSSVLEVARKLAAPYGIEVNALDDDGAAIPRQQLMRGETPFEIIERLCRFRQLLAYDDYDGNLLLARTAHRKGASGFREGINVQRGGAWFSMHERFSEYQCFFQSVEPLLETGGGGDLVGSVADPFVPRHRRRVIIAEIAGGNLAAQDVAKDRATWEGVRRLGRSFGLRITTDAWRDAAQLLYEPNVLVPVDLPTLKVTNRQWLIAEVTFRKGAEGTTCDIVVMPPQAFNPSPQLISQLPGEFMTIPPGSGRAP